MSVTRKLVKEQARLFKTYQSPEYKTFIPNHVTADRMHPLNETQRRLLDGRKREGLWWHVTSGVELSKSSCVRSWARRRLRTAVQEELKARGFNEDGTLNTTKASNAEKSSIPPPISISSTSTDLRGSLRLHIHAALIPAKFVDIKAEVGNIIDAMIGAKSRRNTTSNQVKRPLQRIRKFPAVEPAPHTPRISFNRLKPS